VSAAFGDGGDALQTTTSAMITASQSMSNASRRVIVSNQVDFFQDFLFGEERNTGGHDASPDRAQVSAHRGPRFRRLLDHDAHARPLGQIHPCLRRQHAMLPDRFNRDAHSVSRQELYAGQAPEAFPGTGLVSN